MTEKLVNILEQIDQINSEDTNHELVDGIKMPKELIYGKRMSQMLQNFDTDSELLQIAVRAQHIKRWAIPRSDYPMDRKGYLKWRTVLKLFHGELVSGLMMDADYSASDIKHVEDLLLKKHLHTNPETQTLEDVACLVFLQYYIDEFAKGKEEEKLIDIIQKTWGKMSEKGHELALKLNFNTEVKNLITQALKNAS